MTRKLLCGFLGSDEIFSTLVMADEYKFAVYRDCTHCGSSKILLTFVGGASVERGKTGIF